MKHERTAIIEVLLIFAGLVCLALLLRSCVPELVSAATLRLTFTAPRHNADNGAYCGFPDSSILTPSGDLYLGTPLTDLKEAVVWGRRFSDPAPVRLGAIPLSGAEGDSIAFDLEVNDTLSVMPDSTVTGSPMGTVWLEIFDVTGNKAPCKGSETTFSFPGIWPKPGPPPPAPGTEGLTASYHRWVRDAGGVRQFAGFLGVRVDSTVDFEWGTGSPWPGVVPADSFCVRWEGTLSVPTAGTWTLYVSSEDGFRLYVDGALRRDWWMVTFEQEVGTTLSLTAGPHSIRLEYFANLGHSACHLRWSGPGVAKQIVPRSALTP